MTAGRAAFVNTLCSDAQGRVSSYGNAGDQKFDRQGVFWIKYGSSAYPISVISYYFYIFSVPSR